MQQPDSGRSYQPSRSSVSLIFIFILPQEPTANAVDYRIIEPGPLGHNVEATWAPVLTVRGQTGQILFKNPLYCPTYSDARRCLALSRHGVRRQD